MSEAMSHQKKKRSGCSVVDTEFLCNSKQYILAHREIISVTHEDTQRLGTQFYVTGSRFEAYENECKSRQKVFIVRRGYIPNDR